MIPCLQWAFSRAALDILAQEKGAEATADGRRPGTNEPSCLATPLGPAFCCLAHPGTRKARRLNHLVQGPWVKKQLEAQNNLECPPGPQARSLARSREGMQHSSANATRNTARESTSANANCRARPVSLCDRHSRFSGLGAVRGFQKNHQCVAIQQGNQQQTGANKQRHSQCNGRGTEGRKTSTSPHTHGDTPNRRYRSSCSCSCSSIHHSIGLSVFYLSPSSSVPVARFWQ